MSKENKDQLGSLGSALVVALFTIVFQFIIHSCESKKDAKVEVYSNLYKEQLPTLNRSLLLLDEITLLKRTVRTLIDTIVVENDTNYQYFDNGKIMGYPLFLFSKKDREMFNSHFNYIKNHKDLLDYRIYKDIQNLEIFLASFPLPEANYEKYLSSFWTEQIVLDTFFQLLNNLKKSVREKIDNPHELLVEMNSYNKLSQNLRHKIDSIKNIKFRAKINYPTP